MMLSKEDRKELKFIKKNPVKWDVKSDKTSLTFYNHDSLRNLINAWGLYEINDCHNMPEDKIIMITEYEADRVRVYLPYLYYRYKSRQIFIKDFPSVAGVGREYRPFDKMYRGILDACNKSFFRRDGVYYTNDEGFQLIDEVKLPHPVLKIKDTPDSPNFFWVGGRRFKSDFSYYEMLYKDFQICFEDMFEEVGYSQ